MPGWLASTCRSGITRFGAFVRFREGENRERVTRNRCRSKSRSFTAEDAEGKRGRRGTKSFVLHTGERFCRTRMWKKFVLWRLQKDRRRLESPSIDSDRASTREERSPGGPKSGPDGGGIGSNRREVKVDVQRIELTWPGIRFDGVARGLDVAEARCNSTTTQFNRGEIHKNIGGGGVA